MGPHKEAYPRRNLSVVQKLETFNTLDVLENIVSKVDDTVDMAATMGIKVGWIIKVLEEIDTKRDHFTLLRDARFLKIRLEEPQQEME